VSSGEGGLLSGGSRASGSRGALGSLGASSFAPSQAYLAPDGKYLLRNNTYARCALYTEVITEHESLLSCYLVAPLYSSNGSTLLADAGARLTGEQRVEMKPGQAQVFTQWNDLEVDSGVEDVPNVRVRFDALGTGPMGASGTKGWIDNKYAERYGGALVLSSWKDLMQAAVNTTQNNSEFSFNNTEQSVEDIASKALDANINIKPVGYLLPGTVINVTIARDIDFSTVYENR
jgi:type IV secretion system protein VirB10